MVEHNLWEKYKMSNGKEAFDVDAFIEYHVGDCSCEHGHECQSCAMKCELKKELESEYKRRGL